MNNFLKTISIILYCVCFMTANAQEMPTPLNKKEKNDVIETVVGKYSNWGKVSLTGKFSSDLLPTKATIKVYMEKDKLTLISISAIIFGEVARIELDKDNLLIVNKMTKKYTTITTAELERVYPGAQADLQNLLLGRITIMGKGSLGKRSVDDVEIYKIGEGENMIVPLPKYQPEEGTYAYVVSGPQQLLSQFIMMNTETNDEMTCDFKWEADGGMSMNMVALTNRFNLEGEITFGPPAWGASALERFELNDKYSRTSLKGILQM